MIGFSLRTEGGPDRSLLPSRVPGRTGDTLALGSSQDGPAKAQDLLATPDLSNFDQVYSSDYGPAVSPYEAPYAPPKSPTEVLQGLGPAPSQAPAVPTSSGAAANNSLDTAAAKSGQISVPKTGIARSDTEPANTPQVSPLEPATTPAPVTPAPATTPAPVTPTASNPYNGSQTGLGALTSSPTIDDYIKNVLGGHPTTRMTSTGQNADDILRARPDVYRDFFSAYNDPQRNDQNSTAWLDRVGGNTPEDYAIYWYNTYGKNEAGWSPQTPVGPTTTPPPTQTQPGTNPDGTPTGTNPNPTPGTGEGTGVPGAGTSTNQTRLQALNQAIARAKVAVAGRGLKWEDYQGLFTPLYTDIYNSIPDTDTNPTGYFDPNMANTVLGGEENRQRAGYRQQVLGLQQHLDPHLLDGTINSILEGSTTQAQQMLDNGLKRGQYNDVGYQGGLSAMSKAQQAAKAKLYGYSNDVLSKYDTQLSGVRNDALSAASAWQLGDPYDLSQYSTEDGNIADLARNASAGDLYNLLGNQPLIDLSDMRMSAGTAQGAINLNDLDVLDALAKRKSANSVGRGLGSEGTF